MIGCRASGRWLADLEILPMRDRAPAPLTWLSAFWEADRAHDDFASRCQSMLSRRKIALSRSANAA